MSLIDAFPSTSANIYELYAYDQATSHTQPSGVSSIAYSLPPPFIFPGAIFRDNFFRLINNAPLNPWQGSDLRFDSPLTFAPISTFLNTLIEDNVIEFTDPRGINHFTSMNITAFNNLNPSGVRLPVFKAIAPGGSYQRESTLEPVMHFVQAGVGKIKLYEQGA